MRLKKSTDIRQLLLDNVLYICLFAMIVVIAVISPSFVSIRVLSDILTQSAPKIVLAMGMLVVIISCGMDMTIGRLSGLCAVVSGSLAQQSTYYLKFWPGLPELPIWVPILISLIVGLLVGCITGLVITKLKVPAFLATLGMQMAIYGADLLYINKKPNHSQPLAGYLDSFTSFGTGSVFGISYLILIAVVVMIVIHIMLTKTRLGKNIFALGGNREAAKVSGINIFKVEMFTYLLSGVLAGLAGVMMSARTGSATATYGEGYELDAIASCIIGGASFTGGIGTVPGAFLGVIIFSVINYGLTFIGLSSYWQYIVKGAIIVIAVALDMRKYKQG
jgi:methyl-galactoside transport system permease protein